jgi:sugar phosphate isomerase/epimerase
MTTMDRRSFISKTSLSLAALAMSQSKIFAVAAEKDMALGFQTYPIREMLGKDFPGTLKTMAAMGYKQTEMCYPKGYEKIGFGPLAAMKTADIKDTIKEAGLTCTSCHFGFGEFTDEAKMEEGIRFAKDMGINQFICSTFWLPKTATLNDYLVAADQLNKAAEKLKAAGLQTGFHNHSFEFVMLDGELIYDALMKRFDKDLIKMQFQTEVINLGFKGADYFKKFPGRFFSAHLSDWTADKKQVPIGQGIIDWPAFFETAKTGGVKNFFVEMNFDTLKPSADYINSGRWRK